MPFSWPPSACCRRPSRRVDESLCRAARARYAAGDRQRHHGAVSPGQQRGQMMGRDLVTPHVIASRRVRFERGARTDRSARAAPIASVTPWVSLAGTCREAVGSAGPGPGPQRSQDRSGSSLFWCSQARSRPERRGHHRGFRSESRSSSHSSAALRCGSSRWRSNACARRLASRPLFAPRR